MDKIFYIYITLSKLMFDYYYILKELKQLNNV